MPMTYAFSAIPDASVPPASSPILQHLLETYASETNKVIPDRGRSRAEIAAFTTCAGARVRHWPESARA